VMAIRTATSITSTILLERKIIRLFTILEFPHADFAKRKIIPHSPQKPDFISIHVGFLFLSPRLRIRVSGVQIRPGIQNHFLKGVRTL